MEAIRIDEAGVMARGMESGGMVVRRMWPWVGGTR